jgi:hypothetical protein
MANKKSNQRQTNSKDTREAREAKRRTRLLQIVFVAFSIVLILSMVLSLTQY